LAIAHESQVTSHHLQMENEMSTFFNLLLFVGIFYLILQIPEPGGKRRVSSHTEPAKKVA